MPSTFLIEETTLFALLLAAFCIGVLVTVGLLAVTQLAERTADNAIEALSEGLGHDTPAISPEMAANRLSRLQCAPQQITPTERDTDTRRLNPKKVPALS